MESLDEDLNQRHQKILGFTEKRLGEAKVPARDFLLDHVQLSNMVEEYHGQTWWNNRFDIKKIGKSTRLKSTYVDLADGEDYQTIKFMIQDLNYEVRDVMGDGNCGLYALILGLVNNGKIPKEVLNSNNNLTAAAYKMRTDIHDYMVNSSNALWEKLPKEENGGLPTELVKFMCLCPEESQLNQSRLLHPKITVGQYFEDLREATDEHIEDYGIFGCAALY